MLAASTLWGQSITGTILGTVRDSSGGAMPGATVTVTNEDTGVQLAVQADSVGEFVLTNLSPGSYTIKTEAAGFKQNVVKSVRLLASRSARLDVVLEPGGVAQEIQVTASAPVLNTENATIGNISVPGTVGRITGAGDPRVIQFGLKVLF